MVEVRGWVEVVDGDDVAFEVTGNVVGAPRTIVANEKRRRRTLGMIMILP